MVEIASKIQRGPKLERADLGEISGQDGEVGNAVLASSNDHIKITTKLQDNHH